MRAFFGAFFTVRACAVRLGSEDLRFLFLIAGFPVPAPLSGDICFPPDRLPLIFFGGRMLSCSLRSAILLPGVSGFGHRLVECQGPPLCPVRRKYLRGQGRADGYDGLLVVG